MTNLKAEHEAEAQRRELGALNQDPMGMQPTHVRLNKATGEYEPVPIRSIPRFTPLSLNPSVEKWPSVDSGHLPVGNKIIVQYKQVAKRSKGGIILADDTHDADVRANVTARVVAMGPACFHEWSTGRAWPGAPWFQEGDFVRVPLNGGDTWYVDREDGSRVRFGLFADEHVYAIVTDPQEIA